jgi:hypothetical protein
MKIPNKNKRLKFAFYTLHLMVAVGILGMYWGVDLGALGVYMAVTAIPLVAYILGETFRPSNHIKNQDNGKEENTEEKSR